MRILTKEEKNRLENKVEARNTPKLLRKLKKLSDKERQVRLARARMLRKLTKYKMELLI